MKTTWIFLLFMSLNFISFSQISKENRINEMYQTLKDKNFESFVSDYYYDGFFLITSKDSLKTLLDDSFSNEFIKLKLTSYNKLKISKVIEENNVKYFKYKVEKRYQFTFNKDAFIEKFRKDSLENIAYYDTLKVMMANDQIYQQRLLTDTIDLSWKEDYYYFPDELNLTSESAEEKYENMLIDYFIVFQEKKYKKYNFEIDSSDLSIYLTNPFDKEENIIGILNPYYSNEWKFIENLYIGETYYNFLIPDSVLKKLKIKKKAT